MIDERGIQLIGRMERGESLSPQEKAAVRATMYLIQQTVHPVRDWENFVWPGEEHFMRHTWPRVRERYEIGSGQFAHGAVSP